MDAETQYQRLSRGTKIAGLVFLFLSLAAGIGYLVAGTLYHLRGQELDLLAFVVSGVLFLLVCLFSLLLDIPSNKRMYCCFSFCLSALLGIALSIAISIYLWHIRHESDLPGLLTGVFLLLSILPGLFSSVLSILSIFKKEPPLWALLLAYVFEAVCLIVALYFSFGIFSKILYILIFGLIFLRSSQYMFLLFEEGRELLK